MPNVSPQIQFMDETGINPLPAGILVSLYSSDPNALAYPFVGGVISPNNNGATLGPNGQVLAQALGTVGPGGGSASGVIDVTVPGGGAIVGPQTAQDIYVQNTQTFLGRGWTYPLGLCGLQLVCGATYTACFGGSYQAPGAPITFTAASVSGAITEVTVSGYRSPSFSSGGYALEQTARLVRGWFSGAARAPGGVAYSLAYAFGSALSLIDQQTQQNLGSMRLQSCQDSAIDSWGLDMVGPLFQRFPFESDQLYISRLMLMVSRPRCTINAITAFVQAFYASIAAEQSVFGTEKLGFDLAGSFDTAGGFDTNPPGSPTQIPPPPIYVFDWMTNRKLANEFGFQQPYFAIIIGTLSTALKEVLAEDVAGGVDVSGGFDILPTGQTLPTPSTVAPDPRLGLMINLLAKAGGTVPLYIVGQT